jgi:ankyrin repeat protein
MLLLTAGADATVVRQSDEMTALKFAAKECEPEVIQSLIDKGAEVDGPANTDQTALMLAARSNNLGAIQVLIRSGADPQRPCGLRWAKGRTAAWLAQNEGSAEVYAYLTDL